ncbi:carbohydrate ABC transporter permease [Fimbriimonas ginsengisoli]|uniref:N-Acetyl-D-glucosamine ABC transport system, permease protein 2 n=1 Tax=Fimbriimonas ginsengisoli Gsoil 348 TaxID=661478 RepID=A0A068NRY2_FIMGI|nr:carbohydrate ABC transporter permease [Fimbriimonas ginsengisoli]AIE86077.1 N-Acetyl-D-glucosamine ABC transport system, permease protein 2 [Fimbriimonas ginsengisoli Gsoil 348]
MSARAANRTLKTAIAHIALITLGVTFVMPLLWMVLTALKPIEETMTTPPKWIPSHLMWGNFPKAIAYGSEELGYIPFLVYARNTLLVTILAVTGAVVSNSIVAYSFARLNWKGRDFFFGVTLATMMVPFPVTMVPTFALFRWLGWVGTFRPLWVPAFFASAFSIFLLRQFYKTIPMELSEAAKIDGANEWKIFMDVIVPLSRPALVVVALFSFMGAWNDFLGPLIYLVDQNTFTLSLGLQAYQTQHGGTLWNLLMAASVVVILPVLIVFFFAQKVFIQGIATSGLK